MRNASFQPLTQLPLNRDLLLLVPSGLNAQQGISRLTLVGGRNRVAPRLGMLCYRCRCFVSAFLSIAHTAVLNRP